MSFALYTYSLTTIKSKIECLLELDYTEEERVRHSVRPGLSGLAQANGRNSLSWEEKFAYDIEYVNNITFLNDVKIVFTTVKKFISRADIGQGEESPESFHIYRQKQMAISINSSEVQ